MRVTYDDAAQFFRLMWGLQFFVNQRLEVAPTLSAAKTVEAYLRMDTQIKVQVRDALWEHPELIDAYIQANPDGLPAAELEIIGQWKHFVRGSFFIFRYLKDHAVFIGDTQVYAVKALFEPLALVLPDYPLPIYVDTILLPYKGQIVYDGLIRNYRITFGGGVRGDLQETYMAAKEAGRIIASLDDGAPATLPPPTRRKLKPGSEALVTEIAKKSESLRGGTAIQSAALSLLRASAVLAELAILHPENLDELANAGTQASKALTKLQTAVGRAEYS